MRVRQLCGMLTALHSLAGGIAEPVSFLTLSRFSVGLCESRDGYIVAVLADPGDAHRESVSELARVVARAFARAGGPDLPDLITPTSSTNVYQTGRASRVNSVEEASPPMTATASEST